MVTVSRDLQIMQFWGITLKLEVICQVPVYKDVANENEWSLNLSIYLSVVNTDQCQKIIWNHLPTVVKRMWSSRQGLSIFKSQNHLSVV